MNKKIYNNLSVDNLIKTEWFNQFDEFQKKQIRTGLEDNLNVSIYANPEFNVYQMNQIRLGLQDRLNVSIYAKKDFSSEQMEQIRLGLFFNLDVSIYAKSELSVEEMEEIRKRLEKEAREKLENGKNIQQSISR